jgi:two-component system chemotaxis response regulator CheY
MKKLLVVDDSKAMRMIVRRALLQIGSLGEHEVVEATNGEEALQKLKGENFDLVLADWNMPQMSGLDLLKALRKTGSTVKFGFITSEGTDDVRALAFDAGAQFLIVKPFTPDALHTALAQIGFA